MSKIDYSDSRYTIREDLIASHRQVWDKLSGAGTWLTGEERVKVMSETRHARESATCANIKEALSPFSAANPRDAATDLPETWISMIQLIVADPGRLTHNWYQNTIEGGIPETHFVEIVSVVAHTTAIDTFAHGIGVPLRPLPEPKQGKPSKYRPKEARQHQAWAPNIAWDEFGQNEADYFVGPESNIRRALTLVPDEARSFFDLVSAQYLSGPQMWDFSSEFRAITHLQIELLAARVSALNQCTYWTTSHAALLRAGSKVTGDHLDYGVIVGGSEAGDIGVEHGDILIEFAEAILGVDDERMEAARKAIAEKMGASALVDSAAVAALFNGIDRIADATGAPLEQSKADATVNLRAETGINEFSARKEALNAAQKNLTAG